MTEAAGIPDWGTGCGAETGQGEEVRRLAMFDIAYSIAGFAAFLAVFWFAYRILRKRQNDEDRADHRDEGGPRVPFVQ
jgi:hypothetical protein